MLQRTDHEGGRWHVIAGESKKYARVAVIETVIAELERAMVARRARAARLTARRPTTAQRRPRKRSAERDQARRAISASRPHHTPTMPQSNASAASAIGT